MTGTALILSPSGGTITARAPWKVTVMTPSGEGSCVSTFRIGMQRPAFGGASPVSEVEHAKSGASSRPACATPVTVVVVVMPHPDLVQGHPL